jgi:hypothetical protein
MTTRPALVLLDIWMPGPPGCDGQRTRHYLYRCSCHPSRCG